MRTKGGTPETLRWPASEVYGVLTLVEALADGLREEHDELMVMLALIRLGDAAYGVPISKIIDES